MSTDKGYIKVYRDIRDHWIWTDEEEPFSRGQAWIDLIMMANHNDRDVLFNGRLIHVEKGCRITSLRRLSERWKWSIHKVSDFLNLLEKEGMISQVRDSKKTLITLINYGIYQSEKGSKGTPKEHSRNTQGNHKENRRKSQGNKQDIIEGTKEDIKKKEASPPDTGDIVTDFRKFCEEDDDDDW